MLSEKVTDLESQVRWLEDWSKAVVIDSAENKIKYENHTHNKKGGKIK